MSTLLRALSARPGEDRRFDPGNNETALEIRPEQEEGVACERSARTHLMESVADESLVLDWRADMSPAQMVEQKLLRLLKGKALPVSHMQMAPSLRARHG